MNFTESLNEHLAIAARIDAPSIAERLEHAVMLVCSALAAGKSVLVCGNGGSAADAQHIAGELVGKFLKERPAFDVQCLSTNASVLTAWGNDVSFDSVFARQVEAHGRAGGVLLLLSTSGRSRNICQAAETGRACGLKVISFTGQGGGDLAALSDVLIEVPSTNTPRIQEFHILYYHHLCQCVEARLASA